MTTEIFSTDLFKKILASIPTQFADYLIVRGGEPNSLQLLKLAIRAFFNNILRCHFLEAHGNDYLKALWLIQNIQYASAVFNQYNYMDYYPFVDDTCTWYIPSFMNNAKLTEDVVHYWNLMLLKTPYIMAANGSLRKVAQLECSEVLQRLLTLAATETQDLTNLQTLTVKLMFDIGEYDSAVDKFIDIFLPIDRTDDEHIYKSKRMMTRRSTTYDRVDKPNFGDHTTCMLAMNSEGSRILTILNTFDDDTAAATAASNPI